VLGADVVVPELEGLAKRELKDLLRPWSERYVSVRDIRAAADQLLDLLVDVLQRDVE
jgi:hypothetical protein